MRARPYKTDYERTFVNHVPPALWDMETIEKVEKAFSNKGYAVNYTPHIGVHGDTYPSLEITRDVIQTILEILFRNRIDVELHVWKKTTVSILLLDTVDVDALIRTINYMPKYDGGKYYDLLKE